MSFSEQAEYETSLDPCDAIVTERNEFASLGEYIRDLAQSYDLLDGTRANMLQLQRMARTLTNPLNEPSSLESTTNAFYWGEIIAYRLNDHVSDGAWGARAYKAINESMKEMLFLQGSGWQQNATGPVDDKQKESPIVRYERLTSEKLSELEVRSMYDLLVGTDELMTDLAKEDIYTSEEDEWYMRLGFRYIAQFQLDTVGREDLVRRMFHANDIPYGSLPKGQRGLEDVSESLQAISTKHMARLSAYTDVNDFSDMEGTAAHLTEKMQQDIDSLSNIETGDLVQVSNDVSLVIFDAKVHAYYVKRLAEGEKLQGTVGRVEVMIAPSAELLDVMRAEDAASHVMQGEEVNPLGALLRIEYPAIITAVGEQVPLNMTTRVVVGDPRTYFIKVIL